MFNVRKVTAHASACGDSGSALPRRLSAPRADQRKVDADVQRRRMILGQDDGVMKLASHRHESSSGDDAVAMRLDNCPR
jgi:hypothetical protein